MHMNLIHMEKLENVQSKVFSKRTSIDGLDITTMNPSIIAVLVEKIDLKRLLKSPKNGTFAIMAIMILVMTMLSNFVILVTITEDVMVIKIYTVTKIVGLALKKQLE
jgi:hypothetical protein